MNTGKTREPRRRNSVLRNQALIFIAIILTGVTAVSALYNSATMRFYRAQTTDLAGAVLRQADAALEGKAEQYRHIIELMYLNPKLQNLLFNEYYYDVPRAVARKEILTYLAPFDRNLNDVFTEISGITLYVANRTLGGEPGVVPLEEAEGLPWYAPVAAEQVDRCTWMVTEGADGETVVSAVHPLRNLRISTFPGNFLGYLKMDFNITQYFESVLKASGTADEWMLVTGPGGRAVASTLDPDTAARAAAATAGMPPSEWRTAALGGGRYLVAGEPVRGTDWTIWFAVNEVSLAQAGFRQVNLPVLLMTLAMTAAMAFAAWFAASRLARRIGRLAGAMRALEQGRFDVRTEDAGRDEVAFLAAGFNSMAERLDAHVTREYRDRIRQREYDMQALQAQLHPHFLYNSLASISWLGMQSGSEDIPAISNALARFYRLSLSRGRNIILVSDEADQARAYLDVMMIRYRGRINALFRVSKDVADTWTLKLVLQPFVENALLHGLHVLKNHINLIVSAERDGDALVWKVIDDGVGMPADRLPDLNGGAPAGYGIANVHRRIRTYFGEEYGVTLMSEEGVGTAVMIRMPLLPERPGDTDEERP